MKRILLSLLLVVCLVTPAFSQSGLINPDQIANTIPTTIHVGQNMNAGDLCKIINSGGFKAYKYISRFISMSSPTYLLTGGTNNAYISATRMTDTTAIIAFYDAGDSGKGKAVVATISGGTISMSAPTYMITGGATNLHISATRMTDTTAIIAFHDIGDSGKGKAVVATISGGTISMSTPTYMITGGIANVYISATRMTDTTAIIAFQDAGDSNKGRAVVATISGGTISMSAPTYLLTGGATNYYISATRITDTTAIIAFRDAGDSKGKAVVADIPPIYTYMLPAISNNTVTAGSTGTFSILKPYTKITNTGFSFTGAQPYFIDATTSAWTTTPTNYYVGYALDTTSIMIDGAYYTNTVGGTVGNSTLPVSLIRK